MTFKLKAWMIYLIGVVVIPILFATLITSGYENTPSFSALYGNVLADVVLYGGIALVIYYAIFQRFKKKEQGTKWADTWHGEIFWRCATNLTEPIFLIKLYSFLEGL